MLTVTFSCFCKEKIFKTICAIRHNGAIDLSSTKKPIVSPNLWMPLFENDVWTNDFAHFAKSGKCVLRFCGVAFSIQINISLEIFPGNFFSFEISSTSWIFHINWLNMPAHKKTDECLNSILFHCIYCQIGEQMALKNGQNCFFAKDLNRQQKIHLYLQTFFFGIFTHNDRRDAHAH